MNREKKPCLNFLRLRKSLNTSANCRHHFWPLKPQQNLQRTATRKNPRLKKTRDNQRWTIRATVWDILFQIAHQVARPKYCLVRKSLNYNNKNLLVFFFMVHDTGWKHFTWTKEMCAFVLHFNLMCSKPAELLTEILIYQFLRGRVLLCILKKIHFFCFILQRHPF